MKSPFSPFPKAANQVVLALAICGGAASYKGLMVILGCTRSPLERAILMGRNEGLLQIIQWRKKRKAGRSPVAIVLTPKSEKLLREIGL